MTEENKDDAQAGAVGADAAALAPGEPVSSMGKSDMEIHKPKPVHSWREFFSEISIVVLGVIIAIGLEQAVEWLHWRSEVKLARQAIHTEIAANNANFFAMRIATAPCMDRQIGEADAILAALAAGRRPDPFSNFQPDAGSLIRDSQWESEQNAQVLTHFPDGELALMTRYYGQLRSFGDWLAREKSAWFELAVLQNPPTGMTAADFIRLRADLAIAQNTHYQIILNAKRIMRVTAQLDIPDPMVDQVRVRNFCTMSADKYQRYRSAQDLY